MNEVIKTLTERRSIRKFKAEMPPKELIEQMTYLFDGSLTMGNMLNAAHALGLGSIWIHRAKQEFETEEMKALLRDLGIEGEYEGIGHCAIGYADGELPTPVPRKDGRAFYL